MHMYLSMSTVKMVYIYNTNNSSSCPVCVILITTHLFLRPVMVLYEFWFTEVGVSLALAESSLCVKEELFQS